MACLPLCRCASCAGASFVFGKCTVFPNTAITDPTSQDRQDARPDTVRRAVAFIDEHPHDDITIADIAAAAFVAVRAHHDLITADPASQTVTAIVPGRGHAVCPAGGSPASEARGAARLP